MNNVEILTKARELIATPQRWHKGSLFGDGAGEMAPQKRAVQFCIAGACIYVVPDNVFHYSDAKDLLEPYMPRGFESIAQFNDDERTTHADVLAVLDRAIAGASR